VQEARRREETEREAKAAAEARRLEVARLEYQVIMDHLEVEHQARVATERAAAWERDAPRREAAAAYAAVMLQDIMDGMVGQDRREC
jgi:hypothetical protein